MHLPSPRVWPWLLLGAWAAWFIGVWVHAWYPFLLGRNFDFEHAGQFGDAFGSLASLMASFAAVGAWMAVALQREQLAAAQAAAEKSEKEADQQRLEETYFRLFQQLPHVVEDTSLRIRDEQRTGQAAFNFLVAKQRRQFGSRAYVGKVNVEDQYLVFFDEYSPKLAHFFRFVFHTMKLVERMPKKKDREFFLKLFYSQFSNDQLLLLIANHCFHPKGKNALRISKPYRLLHNTSFIRDAGLQQVAVPVLGKDYFR